MYEESSLQQINFYFKQLFCSHVQFMGEEEGGTFFLKLNQNYFKFNFYYNFQHKLSNLQGKQLRSRRRFNVILKERKASRPKLKRTLTNYQNRTLKRRRKRGCKRPPPLFKNFPTELKHSFII